MMKIIDMNQMKEIKLEKHEIIYTESYLNILHIYTAKAHYTIKGHLPAFCEQASLVRIHESYAINLRYLYDFDNHDVFLLNYDVRLPIGITYRTTFQDAYKHYFEE